MFLYKDTTFLSKLKSLWIYPD